MKILLMVMLLLPSIVFSLSCEKAEKMAEYLSMNGHQFMDAVKKNKIAGHTDELRVAVDDVNQARKMAYKFPPLEDMGFPPVGKNWEPFIVTMDKSSLKGLRSGYKYKNANGDIAVIRLDYDPVKGGHYNIDVMKRTSKGKESYKLSIEFDCNGKKCTSDEIKKMAKNFN